mmetsp:Transcript_18680/g.27029  ORF Transcript_18680/g.27029 Transcript_18680/m.27029 type:complete len:90 (+) Transcript_18680:74-343(+)
MSQITPLPIADPVDVDGEETVTPTAVEVRALRDALAEANARADANAARALAEANARQFYQSLQLDEQVWKLSSSLWAWLCASSSKTKTL